MWCAPCVLSVGVMFRGHHILGVRRPRAAPSSLRFRALAIAALAPSVGIGPGFVETRTFPHGYRAVLYTPAALDRSRPAPLVVMLHGCNMTAEQQEAAGDLDEEAERERFVVLYPDFDTVDRPLPCWRFRSQTRRTSADPAAVAAMVRDAVVRRSPVIDAKRVYVAGISSGAMMTAILGATYPDRFAAIAISAGCAYRADTCIGAAPSRN